MQSDSYLLSPGNICLRTTEMGVVEWVVIESDDLLSCFLAESKGAGGAAD